MANTAKWTNALSNGDMCASGNYTGGTGAMSTWDLSFDGTSSIANATATAGLSCNSVSVTTGHTGTWSMGGYALTVAATSIINGNGTRNLGNGVTLNGNSITFTIANAVMTTTSCAIICNGTGCTWTENRTSNAVYLSLTVNASMSITFTGQAPSFTGGGPLITLGNAATLVHTGVTIVLTNTSASDFFSFLGTYTWTGTIATLFMYGNVSGTSTIPAFTTLSNLEITINPNAASSTIKLTGNLSTAGIVDIYTPTTYTTNIDLNTYNINCATLTLGNNGFQSTTFHFRSGTITCASFYMNSYNTGATYYYFDSCTINCSSTFRSYASNNYIYCGTSTINLTNNCTLYTYGSLFYNISIASGKTVTLNSAVYCNAFTITGAVTYNGYSIFQLSQYTVRTWNSGGSTDMNLSTNYTGSGALLSTDVLLFNGTVSVNAISTAGLTVGSIICTAGHTNTWSISGQTLSVAYPSTIDLGGTRNLGNGIAFNSGTVTIPNATVTSTSTVVTYNGTGCVFADYRATAVYSNFIINNSCSATLVGTLVNIRPVTSVVCIAIGSNATFTQNATTQFQQTSSTPFYSTSTGSVWNGSGLVSLQAYSANLTTNIPTLSYTGAGNIQISPYTNSSITFMGTFSCTTMLYVNNASAGVTIDFNGQTISCGVFRVGTNNAAGNTYYYYRGSAITCTSYDGSSYNTGTCTQNFGTCTINSSGNVVIGSTHTIVAGSEIWNVTSTSTVTYTSASWGTINFKATTNLTVTLGASISCLNYTIVTGLVNFNGYTITQSKTITPSVSGSGPWTVDGNSYTNNKTITLTTPTGILTQYAISVPITDSNIGGVCKSDLSDLRFTDNVGNLLYAEKESGSVSGGVATAQFWVNIPYISTGTTTIVCFYGCGTASTQTNPQRTWNDNYLLVMHMGSASTLSIVDSTGKNTMTNNGSTPSSAGKIGGAASFDGASSRWIDTPNFVGAITNFTCEHWIYLNATQSARTIFANYIVSASHGWVTGISDGLSNQLKFYLGSSTLTSTGTFNTLSNTTWYHVAATYGGANTPILYVNGAQNNTGSYTLNTTGTPANNNVGSLTDSPHSQKFNGLIDELRISNIVRSAVYMAYTYSITNSATGGLIWGSQSGTSTGLTAIQKARFFL